MHVNIDTNMLHFYIFSPVTKGVELNFLLVLGEKPSPLSIIDRLLEANESLFSNELKGRWFGRWIAFLIGRKQARWLLI